MATLHSKIQQTSLLSVLFISNFVGNLVSLRSLMVAISLQLCSCLPTVFCFRVRLFNLCLSSIFPCIIGSIIFFMRIYSVFFILLGFGTEFSWLIKNTEVV